MNNFKNKFLYILLSFVWAGSLFGASAASEGVFPVARLVAPFRFNAETKTLTIRGGDYSSLKYSKEGVLVDTLKEFRAYSYMFIKRAIAKVEKDGENIEDICILLPYYPQEDQSSNKQFFYDIYFAPDKEVVSKTMASDFFIKTTRVNYGKDELPYTITATEGRQYKDAFHYDFLTPEDFEAGEKWSSIDSPKQTVPARVIDPLELALAKETEASKAVVSKAGAKKRRVSKDSSGKS
jgi:hypothetical protein